MTLRVYAHVVEAADRDVADHLGGVLDANPATGPGDEVRHSRGMDLLARFGADREAIAEFCRRNGIRRLAVFGSLLRDDFGPDSDIDLLVEFEPGRTPGLITLSGMEMELESMLGGRRRVDLRTPGDLSKRFRDRVCAEAQPVYDAAA
jgi:predicted nucleotidyltransferase